MKIPKWEDLKPIVGNKEVLFPALFFVFWLMFCATAITFQGYGWLNPFGYVWSFPSSWEMALVLLFLMFVSAKFAFKENSLVTDLPLFWARFGLFTALALDVFLCSYQMNIPPGNYDNDVVVDLYWPRNMKDLGGYGNFASYPALTP